MKNRFQAEKCIYMPLSAESFFASTDLSTLAQHRSEGFLVVIPKRTGSIVAFFGKFPLHLYYIYIQRVLHCLPALLYGFLIVVRVVIFSGVCLERRPGGKRGRRKRTLRSNLIMF